MTLNQMARAAEDLARRRCSERPAFTLIMSMLGGGYVALAAYAMVTVSSQTGRLPPGISALLSGLVFCSGLALIMTAGGQLFTGNCILPMGLLSGQSNCTHILSNWTIAWTGNLIGALIVVTLVGISGLWRGNQEAIALKTLQIASSKMQLSFLEAFARGVLCNWLVTVAVWIGLGANSLTDKIVGLLFPISIFVISGYEHCVANMFFLPFGIMVARLTPYVAPDLAASISWGGLWSNLLPVTLGNAVGGVLFVAFAYSFILNHPSQRVR